MVTPPVTISLLSLAVLLLPLTGFLITGIADRYLKGRTAGYLASGMTALSFLLTTVIYFTGFSSDPKTLTIEVLSWMRVSTFDIAFELLIDPLSVTMMLLVTGVGALIHVYSIGYMKGDVRFNAFFSQMNLFTFSMLLLVMGANYLVLFIGWEGVGLCSYLLIGFWFKNPEYNLAARKAFVMNRIGDLGFLLGILLLFFTFQTVSFSGVEAKLAGVEAGTAVITLITLLLLVGALGKSAQIPLYTWLPDAMAGPTPVSALIHAATMVTAGIYMIARSSALFMLAPVTLDVILVIGLATALLAATIGLYQNDIKKVLAYSTVSQLGYMFLALGLGAFSSAVFHLTTHAFFKALLFLAAGSVIHALDGEQDIRKMGGLRKSLPITFLAFLAGTLAIAGIPPFSGFFSKDEILLHAYSQHPWTYILALGGALLTCFYMFRLLFLVFFGKARINTHRPHESPAVMTIPLILLALLSLAGGFLNIPGLFGGHESFSGFLAGVIHPSHLNLSHSTEWLLLILSLALLMLTFLFCRYLFLSQGRVPGPDGQLMHWPKRLVVRRFYVDELYNLLFVRPYQFLSGYLFDRFHKGVIDRIVNLTGSLMFETGALVRRIQNGNISFYLFSMVAAMLFFFLLTLIIT